MPSFSPQDYLDYYQREFNSFWMNLSPTEYGMVLIGALILGWLLMRSAR